ncbi:hypothetical protein KVT40_000859 [Elsinoe batatas]|uniref:RlpA-like protein double-psi beta-barrel domain-containing protein n=1 Tax=Elsinoe batatas TaxID=2601811 RepID=A0A8K0LAU9_9PEZI|nr:hypothetical protein KVT40_000859 [Elsinoe batatas]
MTEHQQQQPQTNIQVPEWEHEGAGRHGSGDAEKSLHVQHAIRFDALNDTFTSTRNKVRPRFDAILPPNRTYLGLKRIWFVVAIVCAFVALLALIIGLAVGLTGGGGKSQNLPLPSNRETFTGDLTYYEPGLGACGITSSSSENIVAVSKTIFDAAQTGSDPNQNPLCGRKLRASRLNEQTGSQRSVDLTVVDRCVGCKPTDIDVTISAFTKMAAEELGRVTVTWAWL